jgi:hypothetical protein
MLFVLSVILCFGLFQVLMVDMRNAYDVFTIVPNDGDFYISDLGLYVNDDLPEILLLFSVYITMILNGIQWFGLVVIVGMTILAIIAYNTFFFALILPFKGISASANEKHRQKHISNVPYRGLGKSYDQIKTITDRCN